MKREVYREVLGLLSELPFGACPNVGMLRARYPGVAVETFISIYSQEVQYKVIKSNHIHKSRVEEYLARYMAGEDLLLLSAAINFPCCLLLRRMLESLLRVHKQSISDVLRNPSLLPTLLDVDDSCAGAQLRSLGDAPGPSSQATAGDGSAPLKPTVSAHFLARLQLDVTRSSLADCCYSPYADIAKQATGIEFELLLAEKLKAAGLDFFWTEDDLRNQGYYKTPDVRLQVPIAVRDKRAHPRGDGWRIVTWIDSKATFGDDRTHSKQYEEQYSTYVNRYGPGLIIYWFDFIEDLDSDAEVMIMNRFPDADELAQLTSF
ncbi:hypothetical protein DUNSADRAFT_6454 [Dunaliella salina]|uniref:CDAN1-interacting nuclease 1 n=1 Tax=Dunaliella salina TaxID=3046 RepID=A0ABQ7H6W7_DUNSA|nr:hypothetical protein DUNSADRAFT_6454 [Dunaliella salina]|eukprot:KAF5842604.1 hypothetical protein DUNSADRAFT_6454 [Dunaliella salina]